MADHRTVLQYLLVLALVLPFTGKPVHIDDTFVLEITERILENPLDPFSGDTDWFGHLMPIWRATTNPPLISYWLAPVAAVFGFSDFWLHLAMVPFYLLFAWGTFFLARRFSPSPYLAGLMAFCSAPVLVSGNLMRDIPAGALALAGTALAIRGTDRSNRNDWVLAALLLGFAVLAKYSVAVILPVAALYPWLRRKPWNSCWLLVSAIPVGLWCLLTWVQYGAVHPVYLLLERSSEAGIPWSDKAFGSLAILGTGLLLPLLLLAGWILSRLWRALAFLLCLAMGTTLAAYRFYGEPFDWGFQLGLAAGVLLLIGSLWAVFRSDSMPDAFFLLVWFWSHLLFSVFLVPFQAVRHQIVAIVPLTFLVFVGFRQIRWDPLKRRGLMTGVLVLQTFATLVIHFADYEYAATYRHFARAAESAYKHEQVWFVGHWGWKFYAREAGFQMLHRDGPYPEPGDLLIWPEKVHIGDAFSAQPDLRNRLQLLESTRYPGRAPIRVMSMDAKAGFYAVVKRRIPFRWNSESPLEVFRVYKVLPEKGG